MGMVLLTLLPAAIVYYSFFGWGFFIQFILASITGLGCEALALSLRHRSLQSALTDCSTLVTAALLAFSMPPLAPWWLIVSAMAFAILLAKHLYGGLGMNPFNPAMVGYAVLLVSFPAAMTQWLPASSELPVQIDFTQTLRSVLTGQLPAALDVNVLSSASPLAALKSGLALRHTMDEILATPTFGNIAGTGWEWVSMCILLGGLILLMLRIIRWHIPVAMLLTIWFCAACMNLIDPGHYAGAMFNIFSGATLVGAFYIATDPVTAPSSQRGRIIYGIAIGLLTYVIRSFGYYHDGVAFAVLTMNLLTPLIDKFTIPRIYGEV
jgi:electron transport complex protein RnfD